MADEPTPSNTIFALSGWSLNQNIPDESRYVDLDIHLKYTDIDSLSQFEPKERKKLIAADHREKLDKLVQTTLFNDYILLGTIQRPTGVRTKVPFSALKPIEGLEIVEGIFINKIDGAKKKRERKKSVFYCVKMTIAIDIEGQENGLQTVEDRFVLIKAKSFEDAYQKVENKKDEYEQRYLNSDGRFVRWRIESYDDCYETDIQSFKDLNNPEGAEVYSKLKSRRFKKEHTWNGN